MKTKWKNTKNRSQETFYKETRIHKDLLKYEHRNQGTGSKKFASFKTETRSPEEIKEHKSEKQEKNGYGNWEKQTHMT